MDNKKTVDVRRKVNKKKCGQIRKGLEYLKNNR